MNNLRVISATELHLAIEILRDLAVIADPSDYLKTEVEDVISALEGLDSISTEAYLQLNKELQND